MTGTESGTGIHTKDIETPIRGPLTFLSAPAQIGTPCQMCLLALRGGGGRRYNIILPWSCRSSPVSPTRRRRCLLIFHSLRTRYLSESTAVLPHILPPSYSTLTKPLQVANTPLIRLSPRRPLLYTPAKLASPQQQRSHGGHSHGHHHHHDNTYLTSKNKADAGVRITRLGLYTNVGLAISKGIGGWYFNSQALVRDTSRREGTLSVADVS